MLILQGTEVEVLEARKLDSSTFGIQKWTFTAVHAWGEDPKGVWRIKVFDIVSTYIFTLVFRFAFYAKCSLKSFSVVRFSSQG